MLIVLLFCIASVTFILAINPTYALPGASTDRTLTYSTNSLTWDSSANIDKDGVAELSLFSSSYSNAKSENGDKIIAPGTENTQSIRLHNTAANQIEYTAVLYRIDSTDIKIEAALSSDNAKATTSYTLPSGVDKTSVVSAIAGTTAANAVDVIDVDWKWLYEGGNDSTDTALGNADELDNVSYGLYIVVTDPGQDVDPDNPDNPDNPDDGKDDDNNNNNNGNNSNSSSANNGSSNSGTSGSATSSTTSGKKVLPTTGDTIPVVAIVVIAIAALVVIIALAIANKRKKALESTSIGAHASKKGSKR